MRFWFSLGLFAFSVAYFIYGINTLNFMTPFGRPGPGYFPALVGVGLILSTGINLVKDTLAIRQKGVTFFSVSALSDVSGGAQALAGAGREQSEEKETSIHYPKDVMIVVILIAALILLLTQLGGLISMAVFMILLLSIMNSGNLIKNVAYSLLLPIFLYLLFDVWLNASLPIGIFGI